MKQKQTLHGKDGVYKRGGIWLAVIEYPRDKDGKRVRMWTEGFKTRREAEAERDRLRNEIRSGVDTVPEKLSVAALLDRWLAGKTTLSATTRERYAGLIARVKPRIGGTMVTKLRPAHVQELYTTFLTRCRICTLAGEGAAEASPRRWTLADLRSPRPRLAEGCVRMGRADADTGPQPDRGGPGRRASAGRPEG